MANFLVFAALCLIGCAVIPTQLMACKFDLGTDLNDQHPLLLEKFTTDFLYPKTCKKNQIKMAPGKTLRVLCPQNDLQFRDTNLNIAEATIRCVAGNYFGMIRPAIAFSPLRSISCSGPPTADLENTGAVCNNGVLGRIGFPLNGTRFVPIVDQICHNVVLGQTNWVHHKVIGQVQNRQPEINAPVYSVGPFYTNIGINSSIYTRNYQRARLLALLNDQARVDQIIPPTNGNFLVQSQLAPRSDMFYRAQQDGTYFYANTVPAWSTIVNGNLRLVEEIIRSTASQNCKELDVWSGSFDSLAYTVTSPTGNRTVQFTLSTNPMANTTAVPVPRFLFKYALDRSRNQALAFVTLNDPNVTLSAADTICTVHSRCATVYPELNTVARGYTYCCLVNSDSAFADRAAELGLPVLARAQPLRFAETINNLVSSTTKRPFGNWLQGAPGDLFSNIGSLFPGGANIFN